MPVHSGVPVPDFHRVPLNPQRVKGVIPDSRDGCQWLPEPFYACNAPGSLAYATYEDSISLHTLRLLFLVLRGVAACGLICSDTNIQAVGGHLPRPFLLKALDE